MVFNLYRCKKDSPTDGYFNCGFYKTNATKDVVEKIISDIKQDDILAIKDFSNAVTTIIKARGYTCEEYIIEKFGYSD